MPTKTSEKLYQKGNTEIFHFNPRIKPRPVEAGEYRVGDLNSNSFGYEKQPRPKEVGDFFPIVKVTNSIFLVWSKYNV
jgi:hypothetical protein